MPYLSPRTLRKSLRFAFSGLRQAFVREQNFRLQVLAAAVVLVLIVVLPVTRLETAILLLVTASVLVLELANTVVETLLDLLQPRLNHYAGMVKDLMAAAVFLASLGALAVGAIILLPYVLRVR